MFCDILFRKKEGIGLTEMYPAYYGAFHCTAGACRHNCCIGWEIDIDDKSATRYAALPGAFGERVRAAVEPGEPPISISTIIIALPPELNVPKSTVLKPAVLVVTDENSDAAMRLPIGYAENS